MNNRNLLFFFVFVVSVFQLNATDISITDKHRTDYETVKDRFSYTALGGETYASPIEIAKAKSVVKYQNIVLSNNGLTVVSGRGIPKSTLLNNDSILSWSKSLRDLSNAYTANSTDTESKDNIIKLSKHILSQWELNNCQVSDIRMVFNFYDYYQQVWKGWIAAMPVLLQFDSSTPNSNLAYEILDFVKNLYNYEVIYLNPYDPYEFRYSNGDFIYLQTRFMFCMASYNPTIEEQISDFIRIKELYDKYAIPMYGGCGWCSGLNPDGTFVHHGGIYNSYQYQLQQWINDMDKMRGTAFRITETAYNYIAKSVVSLYLQSQSGDRHILPQVNNGRHPVSGTLNTMILPSHFQTLVKIGGDINGQPFDTALAEKYNYLTAQQFFAVDKQDLDGFYQQNYAGMGIYRGTGKNTDKRRWTVVMRGLTSKYWGPEYTSNMHTFGRYVANGTLEVLYSGTSYLQAYSGYPNSLLGTVWAQWDWNAIPGTTVVRHTPNLWYSIQVINSASRLWQEKNFVGAIELDKSGVFSMDYKEDIKNGGWGKTFVIDDNLEFKKTVFAHDYILVCLASDIKKNPTVSRSNDTISTNLFQFVHSFLTRNSPFFINGSTPAANGTNRKESLSSDNWLISPAGTGFYIPGNQNGLLRTFKGQQSVPQANVYPRDINSTESTYSSKMVQQDASKAWIAHPQGTSSYEYVVIPATTPQDMMLIKDKLGSGKGLYSVLQQNSAAHVVNFNNDNLTCYAIYEPATSLPAPLSSSSEPCLIMLKPTTEELGYRVAVCSPDLKPVADLNFQSDNRWYSSESVIQIKIAGSYTLKGNTNKVKLLSSNAETTILEVNLKDGFTEYFNLIQTPSSLGNILDNAVRLYPNPCKNELYLENYDKLETQWKIIDLSGRIVNVQEARNNTIATKHLSPGFYILRNNNGDQGVFIKK